MARKVSGPFPAGCGVHIRYRRGGQMSSKKTIEEHTNRAVVDARVSQGIPSASYHTGGGGGDTSVVCFLFWLRVDGAARSL